MKIKTPISSEKWSDLMTDLIDWHVLALDDEKLNYPHMGQSGLFEADNDGDLNYTEWGQLKSQQAERSIKMIFEHYLKIDPSLEVAS